MAEQQAWERLPNETDKAWAAFCEYRDMGSQRSIAKVAAKNGLAGGHYEVWSRENSWVERARAWDAFMERKRRRENEDGHTLELEQFRVRRRNFGAVATETATIMLQILNQSLRASKMEMDEEVKKNAKYKPHLDKSAPAWARAAQVVSSAGSEAEGDAIGVERLLPLLAEREEVDD